MADMEVDEAPTTTVAKGKGKADGKDGKQRFEVKKVCVAPSCVLYTSKSTHDTLSRSGTQ